MRPEELMRIIADVRDDFQREEDQGLLQHDMHKAEQALAGKYACDRVQRAMATRIAMTIVPPKSAGRMR